MTKTRPKMTVGEAFESLTGVDTDAIEHHYGHSIYHWPDDHKDPWGYAGSTSLAHGAPAPLHVLHRHPCRPSPA